MDFGALYDFLFNTWSAARAKRSSITSLTRTIGPFSMTTKTTSNVFAFVPNGDQTMRIAF